jgi:O-antigen/teichoic acid export membrane protein
VSVRSAIIALAFVAGIDGCGSHTRYPQQEYGRIVLIVPSDRQSLKRRVIGAGLWSLAGFASIYAIRLGGSLVLTRFLVPQMFGVMAIAGLIGLGLAMISDLGLRQNITQSKRGTDTLFLNTAWVIQIFRGLLLWLLALCIAGLIFFADNLALMPKGSVYADPYLPYVVAATSASAVITGFQSTKYLEASRHLALGGITLIQILAQVIGLLCTIIWIIFDRSIWALVCGGLSASLVASALSHGWLPGTSNRLQWDSGAAREILHLGKWMFLSSLLNFLANSADRLLLGALVDGATFGIYTIAYTVLSSIAQILVKIINDVSYSAISEVERERPFEIKRSLYRLHAVSASSAYLCSGFLIVGGSTLIHVLYDPRYGQAGWMLQLLAVALVATPFSLGQVSLLVRGLPRMFANISAVRIPVALILIPVGFHMFGLPGAIWAIVLGQLSSVPVTIHYQTKFDLFDLSKEFLLLPTLLAGMLLGKGFDLVLGQ